VTHAEITGKHECRRSAHCRIPQAEATITPLSATKTTATLPAVRPRERSSGVSGRPLVWLYATATSATPRERSAALPP
jgi:hypothetical protein